MRRHAPVVQSGRVSCRHIVLGQPGDPGAVQVLGAWLVPAPNLAGGRNGLDNLVAGSFETRLGEEGLGTLKLPNAAGPDGARHLERFAITRPGYDNYRPGDEWVEIFHQGTDRPRFVGTPIGASVSRQAVELRLADGFWLTKKVRETAAGFWAGAPRDAIEHYTGVWQQLIVWDGALDTAATWSATPAVAEGLEYVRGSTTAEGFVLDLQTVPATAYIRAAVPQISSTDTDWRVEARISRGLLDADSYIAVGLFASNGVPHGAVLMTAGDVSLYTTGSTFVSSGKNTNPPGPFTLAVEQRGRWLFGYLDGQLIGVTPSDQPSGYPGVAVHASASATAVPAATVHYLRATLHTGWLLTGPDKGDLRLPGAPTPGGLTGEFFNDADLEALHTTDFPKFALNPTRTPSARRIDAQLNFPAGSTPGWQPSAAGDNFTARWTGTIWLDLAADDWELRLDGLADLGRVWVGRTRFGDQLIEWWDALTNTASGSLRTQLATSESGWYPIVVEYAQMGDPVAGGLALEWSQAGGAWQAVPADKLSPLGCYQNQVIHESHYEQLRALIDQFGLQLTCEPRQLESGEFPGQMIPKVRHGRDTEKVLDSVEGTDLQTDISAEEVADCLVADAAGIAADGAQLTAEELNFAEAAAGHLFLQQEAESLSDITIESNLRQRLDSLLALRSSPWEEVGAKPSSRRELLDSFPLTGQLAEFHWEPGDGIRLDLPELGVKDSGCRQIMGVSWPFTPDGLQSPTIAFRQRPRNFRETLRRLQRQALSPQRTYQGQLTTVQGSIAGNPSGGGTPNQYTIVALPLDLTDVVKAELVVRNKSNASQMDIEVNGTARYGIHTIGRYDLTPYVAAAAGTQGMHARLTGGSGSSDYMLELKVKI